MAFLICLLLLSACSQQAEIDKLYCDLGKATPGMKCKP